MLQDRDSANALLDFNSRRPAHHEETTRPLGGVVLLLPPGRPSSRDASIAAHRQAHQLGLCAREVEGELQRHGASLDRSRTAATHSADWLFIRRHQRAKTGGRTAHASGVALVYRLGL